MKTLNPFKHTVLLSILIALFLVTAGFSEDTEECKPPRLVDLGSERCIPCKMMQPILESLKITHKDKFDVEFIDISKNPEAGKSYNIRVIPTQIFYNVHGKEIFRNEGFLSKEDILKKWKELGMEF